MGDRSLHCGNRHFGRFRQIWEHFADKLGLERGSHLLRLSSDSRLSAADAVRCLTSLFRHLSRLYRPTNSIVEWRVLGRLKCIVAAPGAA